jgi:hypothetical protein
MDGVSAYASKSKMDGVSAYALHGFAIAAIDTVDQKVDAVSACELHGCAITAIAITATDTAAKFVRIPVSKHSKTKTYQKRMMGKSEWSDSTPLMRRNMAAFVMLHYARRRWWDLAAAACSASISWSIATTAACAFFVRGLLFFLAFGFSSLSDELSCDESESELDWTFVLRGLPDDRFADRVVSMSRGCW